MSVDITNIDQATLSALYAQFRADQVAEETAAKIARNAARVAREEAKRARAEIVDVITPELTDVVRALTFFTPCEPAKAEGSTYVGTTMSSVPVTVDGVQYAVTISVRDIVATDARKSVTA